MELTVAGLLVLGAAVVLFAIARANRRLARLVLGTTVSTIDEITVLHASVIEQVDAGLFSHPVALQGVLHCDEPLHADLTHEPCVAFRYRVERQWEEVYEDRDSQGGRVLRSRGGRELVALNDRRVPFRLRDGTGEVLVLPDGATLEMEQTAERFEPHELHDIPHRRHLPQVGGRRTLGYHFREESLPVGRTAYVLGQATDRDGGLTIGVLPGSTEPFLVSLRTREQILRDARRTMALAHYAAIACGPLGVILLLLGIVQRR
jgi:hypothetical protein